MRKNPKNGPQTPREANPREIAMAHFLSSGDNATVAARKSGYSEATARRRATQIARRESVKQALLQIEAAIKPQELGRLSKARVHQELLSLPGGVKGGKLLLGYARTAAEMDGLLGGAAELHLHQHQQNFPPIVVKMLSEKTAEILMERYGLTPEKAAELMQQKSGVIIDVGAIRPKAVEIPAEISQPASTAPPDPIQADLDHELEQQAMERARSDLRRTYIPPWKRKA
jgi:hypothetical protein